MKLDLPLNDPDVEIDLEADSEVDRASFERFTARGGILRFNGFKLTIDGVPFVPLRTMRRAHRGGDIARGVRRRRA